MAPLAMALPPAAPSGCRPGGGRGPPGLGCTRTRRRRALRRRRLERLARAVAHLQEGVFEDQAEQRISVHQAQEAVQEVGAVVGNGEPREKLHDASGARVLTGLDEELLALHPGSAVRLKGLEAAPELNGSIGHLQEFHSDRGRWAVILPGSGPPRLVRPQNLVAARGLAERNEGPGQRKDGSQASKQATVPDFKNGGELRAGLGHRETNGEPWAGEAPAQAEHLPTTEALHDEQLRKAEVIADGHRHAIEALNHANGELQRTIEALIREKTEYQHTIETMTNAHRCAVEAHINEKAGLQQAIDALRSEKAERQRVVEALGNEGAKQKRKIDGLLDENRRVLEAFCNEQAEHRRVLEDFGGDREYYLHELTRLAQTLEAERDKKRALMQAVSGGRVPTREEWRRFAATANEEDERSESSQASKQATVPDFTRGDGNDGESISPLTRRLPTVSLQ